ncbi:MAG: hypothetical protein OEM41_10885, partial [Ignavibacteria bacterium]|nr:hypothetical protein [Ignavibacteria bacterium]
MKRRCVIGLALLVLQLNGARTLSHGTVYLVLGSDTAIWEGLDVARYNCTLSPGLFSDPSRNATRVMDPVFRSGIRDSYGTPLKLTWWMMAGNMFRHATNTDVLHPNTMTLHLMKRYHGSAIQAWGDELTLHYHTFVWSDYNGDGKWYWNQSATFAESAEDFNQTLAALLLEEETFPVSFRSGWHYMDNEWQRRLDSILPYSLHNDWPAVHSDTTEPIDNNYDWSRAPSTFVPFHPSPDDYQVPGPGRGWNVRSEYMGSVTATLMSPIFAAADSGIDQVACFWAHLPESDFPENIQKVDAAVRAAAQAYPDVTYRYCTAVEAMQLWRGCTDTTRPRITLEETGTGEYPEWHIETDEPIFQYVPFVAVKDRNESFHLLPAVHLSGNTWQITSPIARIQLAKVGVAVTDTAGNYTTALLRYLPDDIVVDNGDPGYTELSGQWTTSSTSSWGTTSRILVLGADDSAAVRWTVSVPSAHLFNIFIRIPEVVNPAQQLLFRFFDGTEVVDSLFISTGLPPKSWIYLGTRRLGDSLTHAVEMQALGATQAGSVLTADAVRFSALVRDKWLVVPDVIDGGTIIVDVPAQRWNTIRNAGIQPVQIASAYSVGGTVSAPGP